MNINKIFQEAIEKNASDIHLVAGKRPMLRVARELNEIEDEEILDAEDMDEMYDYFVRGNIQKDEEYSKTKKLDFSYEYEGVRFRGNISSSDDIPVATLRLIKNTLPISYPNRFKISSYLTACSILLGNPSIIKPFLQSLRLNLFSIN